MVKWKFPTVALESEQRGQACIEGLIFLQKTRRPFVFVLLSNFENFFFFKVERDQNKMNYSQSDELDTDIGFAHS